VTTTRSLQVLETAGSRDAAASGDDPEAFEAAVRPHYANLVRRLVLVLGNQHDAEDIAQDAYLKAYQAWGRFDGSDTRAWLYTIGLRLAFNQLRGRRRWLAALQRIEPRPWTDPSDPDLWAAIRGLDVRTRSALLLNVVDGYTQAEIARCAASYAGTATRSGLAGDGGAPGGTRTHDL
jgi:RNA polymerase sigma factor (sigma-70 family)